MVRCTERMRERLESVLNREVGENVSDVVRILLEREIVRREREAMAARRDAPADRFGLLELDAPQEKGPSK